MNEWISRRRSSVDTTCISSISMNEWKDEYLGEDLVYIQHVSLVYLWMNEWMNI